MIETSWTAWLKLSHFVAFICTGSGHPTVDNPHTVDSVSWPPPLKLSNFWVGVSWCGRICIANARLHQLAKKLVERKERQGMVSSKEWGGRWALRPTVERGCAGRGGVGCPIVMQISSPCPQFVAGNLISSCVAGYKQVECKECYWRHAHTEWKTFHFTTSLDSLPQHKSQLASPFFEGIWQDLFSRIQAARGHNAIHNLCDQRMWWNSHKETISRLNT